MLLIIKEAGSSSYPGTRKAAHAVNCDALVKKLGV